MATTAKRAIPYGRQCVDDDDVQAVVEGYAGAVGITALRRFIASFREGAAPVFTPDDSLRVLEVLDAAQESAGTGSRVRITHEPTS